MGNFSMKLASTVSATAIVASAMSASLVSAASEFLPYAEALAKNKVINAQSTEAGYRLNDYITRAELAKVAANLGQYTSVSCTGNVYTDVTQSLGDLCDAIETLAAAKVVSTANTTFRPNANVTRAEMTKMILGALGETQSMTSAGYSDVNSTLGDLEGFINKAAEKGIVNKGMYFRPNANGSRGEVFKIAAKAANLQVDNMPVDPNTPVQTGSVMVSAVGSASAQYVPMNASSVNVGTFKLTANGGDVTVNNITIGRSGLGNSGKVSLSLSQNNTRVSDSRTVNTATQESVVRLTNPVKLKKGESIELSVLASVNSDQNSQHQFAVKAVNGTAVTPVTLGLINTTSYEVSKVTVDKVRFNSVNSGRNDQLLGSVSFRNSSKEATMNAFTLTKEDGIDLTRALSNVKVYRNGTAVGTVSMTSDKIVVSGLATDLDRNTLATYDLRADVIHVGAAQTIKLGVTNSEDVSVTEKATGFIMQVAGWPKSSDLKLGQLDITVNNKSSSSTTNTVSQGASNVMFIDSTVSASTAFEVVEYVFETKTYSHAANNIFENLTLTVDGEDYQLIEEGNYKSHQGINVTLADLTTASNTGAITKAFRIEGSPVSVQLRGDIKSSSIPNDTKAAYSLKITKVKNLSTGNSTTLENAIEVTGNTITVKDSALEVRNATVSAPSGDKIYSDARDLEIARFGLEAKADDMDLRNIVVSQSGSAAGYLTGLTLAFTNARLINVADGSTVASNGTIAADKITFNSANLRINKNTTTNLKVVVDTKSNLNDATLSPTTAGKKFQAKIAGKAQNISTNTEIDLTGTANTKTYTINSQAPTVQVTALPLNADAPVSRIKFTNEDPNQVLKLEGLKLRVAFRTTTNGTAPAITGVCLRNVGSASECTGTGTPADVKYLAPQANGLYDFTDLAGLNIKDDITSGNYSEVEVFVLGVTDVAVAGDNVTTSVQTVKYDPAQEESYVGRAGASAVSTK